MTRTKRTRKWLLTLLILAVPAITGCAGDVNVGYSPVSACSSVDLDPIACDR